MGNERRRVGASPEVGRLPGADTSGTAELGAALGSLGGAWGREERVPQTPRHVHGPAAWTPPSPAAGARGGRVQGGIRYRKEVDCIIFIV